MKKINKAKAIVIFMAAYFFLFTTAPAWASIVISNSTQVPLELSEELSSQTGHVGQSVRLRLMKDILINNQIVATAGSPAYGEITYLKKSGAVGKNGEISIQVKTLSAVDGTLINITGSKSVSGKEHQAASIVLTILCCLLFLIMKGDKAVLPVGTPVDATVLGNQTIRKGIVLGHGYVPKVLEPTPLPQPKKHSNKSSSTSHN